MGNLAVMADTKADSGGRLLSRRKITIDCNHCLPSLKKAVYHLGYQNAASLRFFYSIQMKIINLPSIVQQAVLIPPGHSALGRLGVSKVGPEPSFTDLSRARGHTYFFKVVAEVTGVRM